MSRKFSLRTKVFAAAAGTLALLATLVPAATGAEESFRGPKPTVVLVHGAFADASSWTDVVERLQRNGFPVIAAPNELRGTHHDAEVVRGLLDSVKGPVVLVGHSYGGTVISEAAAGDKDVKALVYIAAFAPEVGESSGQLAGKFPGGKLGPDTTTVVTTPGGTDTYIKPEAYREVFAADLTRTQIAVGAASQRPIAGSALGEASTAAAWKEIPSWYLVARQDNAIPAAAQRFMAERAHAHTTEVNASHSVAVSRPDATASTIVAAARATR